MGVGIPSHLAGGYALALFRPAGGGLSGWSSPLGDIPAYWEGQGYVSLSLGAQVRAEGSAEQTGAVLFHLEPPPSGGELPKASDRLYIGGVEATILGVRPPNALVGFWKLEVRTGIS